MIVYHIRDIDDWLPGKQYTLPGQGNRYGNDWFLTYKNSLVAAFVYPAFENYHNPQLYQCKAVNRTYDDGVRVACTRLTCLKKIDFPDVLLVQRQQLAVMCSLIMYQEPEYIKWANNWLRKHRDIAEVLEQYERLPSARYHHSKFPIMATYSIIAADNIAAASAASQLVYTVGHVDLETACKQAIQIT